MARGRSSGSSVLFTRMCIWLLTGDAVQFYTACAQISVSGGSGSGWAPDLSIPGDFSESDSGYTANVSHNLLNCVDGNADEITDL